MIPSYWVASLNRPGGNITGMSMFSSELPAKNIQLLKEFVPDAAVIALLVNPSNPSTDIYVKEAAAAGKALLFAQKITSLARASSIRFGRPHGLSTER
jgi:ABC-type uncharacterized transport system substrate-binding protein